MSVKNPIKDHDHWMRLWRLHFAAARKKYPTEDLERLQRLVTRAMVASYGKCPPKPKKDPKPPLKVRIGLWFVRRKLEDLMDGKKSRIPKWILALAFGLAASYSVFDLALADGTISLQEWVAIGNAVIVAALGKFSNPEKKLSHLPSVK